jgi:RNA polymerase sigma factor (TIGR02999 family)
MPDGLRQGLAKGYNRASAAMADVTELLDRWSQGDADALEALMPLVYEELHQLASHYLRHERAGHTLQPTALVHEAYLRLSGVREMRLQNRTHFYGASANVMRRVLVDHARRRNAGKRSKDGAEELVSPVTLDAPVDLRLDLVALDRALDRLGEIAPDKAKVVELRYFGGLSVEETAEYLNISPRTVKRHWRFARAWLFSILGGTGEVPDADGPANDGNAPCDPEPGSGL